MTKLMLGNEAVARGLLEAGCHHVFSYPGTPSTEITEAAATYTEIDAEWAPNEKVALEAAIGASIAGARAFCAMKHVGLNVSADPLFTAVYTGTRGGLVVAVADDPGMHSSQNEQDTRQVAIAAKIPVLEACDSMECKELVVKAFEISEEFNLPVILRLTTRVAHSRSLVTLGEIKEIGLKDFTKDPQKYVMVPANAKNRRIDLETRLKKIEEYSETSGINSIEDGEKLGFIASGISRLYVKEVAKENAGLLHLRMLNPLPKEMIKSFSKNYDRIIVAEELDPVIENCCKTLGIECDGKSIFPSYGEYSRRLISEKLGYSIPETYEFTEEIPLRPPVLCSGCPHRGLFLTLRKLGVFVSGDIGCYSLGAAYPLLAMDTCICMGASVSSLHGILKARPDCSDKAVAVIGDSTFMHSGITGLIDIVYNRSNATVIILDNRTTGMTGHQNNPTSGYDAKGREAPEVNLVALAKACGVKRVKVVDPYNLKETEETIKEELKADEPSVIVAKRQCVLLKNFRKESYCFVKKEECKNCKVCISCGCPTISMGDNTAYINKDTCTGCGVCKQVCPFGAIGEERV